MKKMYKIQLLHLLVVLITTMPCLYGDKYCPECKNKVKYPDTDMYCPEHGLKLIRIEPKKPVPKQKELKQIKLTKIRLGPGMLEIESRPEGVSVYLNDEHIGTTPIKIDTLAQGDYIVKMSYPDYEDHELEVSIWGVPGPKSLKELSIALHRCEIADDAKNRLDNIEYAYADGLAATLRKSAVFGDVLFEQPLLAANIDIKSTIAKIDTIAEYKNVLDQASYNSAKDGACFIGSVVTGAFFTAGILFVGGGWAFLALPPAATIGAFIGRANVSAENYQKEELQGYKISVLIEYKVIDKNGKVICSSQFIGSETAYPYENLCNIIVSKLINEFASTQLPIICTKIKKYYKLEK